MTNDDSPTRRTKSVDTGRRRLLRIASAGTIASAFGGWIGKAAAAEAQPMRWGVVGTGGIANLMAPRIKQAQGCELAAVSSRRMDSAREFAGRHSVPNSYDSWLKMAQSDDVDAIYIATPTSVKEEIGLASVENGKTHPRRETVCELAVGKTHDRHVPSSWPNIHGWHALRAPPTHATYQTTA